MKWTDRDGFLAQIKNEERFGIFLDMGVGKTALLLALADEKIFQQGHKKILIITPKNVSLATWQKEIDKWTQFNYMTSILKLIEGTPKKRNKIFEEVGEHCIHIVSSGLVSWLNGTYEKKISKKTQKEYKVFHKNLLTPYYDMIIVDECSQFKTVTTARFKALKKIVNDGLFLLSGTPYSNVTKETDKKTGVEFYNNADELYYIFNLLQIYQRSLTEFRTDFCYTVPWDQFNYKMKAEVYDVMIDTLNAHCIRKKLDLNVAKKEYKIYCESDTKRMKTLTEEYYLESYGDEEVMVSNKANMINKSLQLSNGFVYDEIGDMIRLNTYKYEKMLEIMTVITGNIIIFYNFVEDKEFLLDKFSNAKLYEGAQTETDWNNGKIEILILSPFSNKYGLNIQEGGHTIIWFGLVWSAESYKQANARLYRPGQLFDVDIFYLLASGTYDDYVYNKLVKKITVIDDFISYVEEIK